MEKQLAQFKTMDRAMLMETNGGGFAYDAGRFLRSLGIYMINGGGIPGLIAEAADSAVCSTLNDI